MDLRWDLSNAFDEISVLGYNEYYFVLFPLIMKQKTMQYGYCLLNVTKLLISMPLPFLKIGLTDDVFTNDWKRASGDDW